MRDSDSSKRETIASEGRLARTGLALAAWSERWFPNPAVVTFLCVVVVFVLGVFAGEDSGRMAFEDGKGSWALVPFTMQMVMIIVGEHVIASTAAARGAIRWLAGLPATPRRAVAWVALFSMLVSLISWGLSLIFSGLPVREMARRLTRLDYRAAGAAP
jgi:short-chain fatty acids transporter